MVSKSKRILIVDDDADLAESLAEFLVDHSHQVAIAEDGRDAVSCATAWDFDVIFMDVRMPVMNGVDSFFAIKSIKPQARIVMMTGYREAIVERAIQAGAEGPLYKPFDVEEMLALVENSARVTPAVGRKLPAPPPAARLISTPSRTIH
jgi:two-component system, NtrC family, response regulator HydG